MADVDELHQFSSTDGDFQSSYYCKSVVLQNGLENKRLEIINELANRGWNKHILP